MAHAGMVVIQAMTVVKSVASTLWLSAWKLAAVPGKHSGSPSSFEIAAQTPIIMGMLRANPDSRSHTPSGRLALQLQSLPRLRSTTRSS